VSAIATVCDVAVICAPSLAQWIGVHCPATLNCRPLPRYCQLYPYPPKKTVVGSSPGFVRPSVVWLNGLFIRVRSASSSCGLM
jgi:hypothetical protein